MTFRPLILANLAGISEAVALFAAAAGNYAAATLAALLALALIAAAVRL